MNGRYSSTGSRGGEEDPRQCRVAIFRGVYPRSSWGVWEQGCERTLQEGSCRRDQRSVRQCSPHLPVFCMLPLWVMQEMPNPCYNYKVHLLHLIWVKMDYQCWWCFGDIPCYFFTFVTRFHWDWLRLWASWGSRSCAENWGAHSERMPPPSVGAAQGPGGCNHMEFGAGIGCTCCICQYKGYDIPI